MNNIAQLVRRFFAVMCLSSMLCACGGWESHEEWGSVGTWSDDGESILIHKSFYERKQEFGASHYTSRNFETQIFTVSVNNLTGLTALTSRQPGMFVGATYMHSAGYALVERRKKSTIEEVGNSQATKQEIYFDKITLNGSITSLISVNGTTMLGCANDGGSLSYPGPVDVLLSPNGDTFAVFHFDAGCDETTGTVSFLNASDLAVIQEPSALKLDEFNAVDSFFSFEEVWFQSGEVFAGFFGGFGATGYTGWKYAPGQEPVRVENVSQECVFKNDYANDQGQRVEVRGSQNDTPTIVVVDNPNFTPNTDCP